MEWTAPKFEEVALNCASLLTDDQRARHASEMISQFSATSSNFGAVHSMVFLPSKSTLTDLVFDPLPYAS